MKKLMSAVLGLSLLTGLATVSFARPDDKTDDTTKTKTKKSKGKKSKTKKDDSSKMDSSK